ncbi:MAG: porphobilinogen synthase [Deltaproteobacteria bacterium]|nr:porphobilinogen synthase [Deltaproteobacteria bacterium]
MVDVLNKHPGLTLRPRRLRRTARLRNLVAETELNAGDLIQGVFVEPGKGVRKEIPSMPGVFRMSTDVLTEHAKELEKAGVAGVMIFGIPETKDEHGSGAHIHDGIVQQALETLRKAGTNLVLVADACFCEYTTSGHCGVLSKDTDTVVDNDRTLEELVKVAVSQAKAGADVIAPSGMMDGTVARLRTGLDAAGFSHIPVMMYSVKYASAYYGPFREAAEGAPRFGDRRSYQMDPRNGREALLEASLDLAEGADIVMVKPALAYLDVIRRVREISDRPVAAYNVSGEYSMVKAAAKAGWVDEKAVVLENLTAMKRAGADIIVTYHAPDVARWLAAK